MTTPDWLKRGSLITAKNAVNAALTALGPVAAWHYTFKDWKHVAVIMASAVVSREAMVWVPKLLKWSSSGVNNGNAGAAGG